MNKELYLIPYSLKSLNLSQEEQFKLIKEMGYDGVEGGSLTPEYLELLDKYGLKGVHFSLTMDENGVISDESLKLLEESTHSRCVGLRSAAPDLDLAAFMKMRMAAMSDPNYRYKGIMGAFGTFKTAVAAAEKANTTAAIAARYGLCTYYHNHTHEWRMDNGEYVMDTYLRHSLSNHVMEFDVGWALTAGIDPIYWMKRWPGRIGALHIKSCNWALGPESLGMSCPLPGMEDGITKDQQDAEQAHAESPQGPMEKSICDWAAVIAGAREAGCETFIIERERIYNEPKDIVACLQADHDWIRKCL